MYQAKMLHRASKHNESLSMLCYVSIDMLTVSKQIAVKKFTPKNFRIRLRSNT